MCITYRLMWLKSSRMRNAWNRLHRMRADSSATHKHSHSSILPPWRVANLPQCTHERHAGICIRRRSKKEKNARVIHTRDIYIICAPYMVNMSIMLAQWIYVLMWNNKFVMRTLNTYGVASEHLNEQESKPIERRDLPRGRGRTVKSKTLNM